MSAILDRLKGKINPAAAREAARMQQRIDYWITYKGGVKAESLDGPYDPQAVGEAQAFLGLDDTHWTTDVAAQGRKWRVGIRAHFRRRAR